MERDLKIPNVASSAVKMPTFASNGELVRYVDEVNRLAGNRTAAATFIEAPSDDPKREYLSVNALDVESMDVIAEYYREKWQSNDGLVAICAHKVFAYNEAGKKSGVNIFYDRESSRWMFQNGAKPESAYEHHPVLRSDQPISKSHSGVEFVRALSEHNKGKFARRLSGKRFHLL